ncbi:MAG: hypothetical protein GY842_14020, partial [bacterium]|nr:hypothetical protein [bacterium]
MYRAIIAAVSCVVFAAPGFASIQGSYCTTSDPYFPGSTASMCWTCTSDGPTTNPECLNEVALGYPDGWTVACDSQDGVDSAGNPVDFNCTAGGQNVTYSDNNGGPGEICPDQSWSFCVNVTAPASASGTICAFYSLTGDGSGGDPHEIIDCGTCMAVQGSVTIVKQTVPADSGGQLFDFTGDLGAFS